MKKIWTAAFLLLLVAALTVPGMSGSKAAPDFTLKDVLQGKEYSLSQFKGKVVLINFFTFFCGPCREEMPELNKIYQENAGNKFETLGIALSSDPVQVRFLIKQLGVTYPVLIGDEKVSQAYGNIEVVPTTFIIDKDGNIVHKILGTRKKEEFERMIKALL
ncbi:MAG: TlpA family protein disulfide reductase [Deltaproteobacteria bacterium]|nr:TlpA family protein disulfide reductase [Deltaproteobacteria bacterium]